MSSRIIGIKDVAVAAGVSATTVSHVLNDVPYARVSPETRNKVRSAAAQLGYGPNRLARALRTQRTGMLGLVCEDIAATPHAGRIILGAEEAAKARGYNLLIINTSAGASLASRQADVAALMDRRVDGILYATMHQRKVELPANVGSVPAVLVGSGAGEPEVPAVAPDEEGGMRDAVQALLDAGHTRIGFICGADGDHSTRPLVQAFRATLDEAGLDGGAAPVESGVPEAEGGYGAARRILSCKDGADMPTAFFCWNDLMAMGAYSAAAESGLSIPGDLSIISFADQELIADNLRPALTTVELPHYGMGARAVGLLIDAVEGADLSLTAAQPAIVGCTLVARGSVAAPPGQAT